jgi:NAD(P)H-flavin reductase
VSDADPMLPTLMPISDRRQETKDTFTIELTPPDGFEFQPGQFNMLYLPGWGEVPISISGDPDQPSTLVHTIRAVGAVTRRMSQLAVGDSIGVRGPFGTRWPEPTNNQQLVVVAGGIGLAPLKPLLLRGLNSGWQLFLIYGARTPADILYGTELSQWATHSDFNCVVTVDRGDPGWAGHTGLVTKFIPQLGFYPARAWAATCGPEVMMRFAARELHESGLPNDRIFVSLERNMRCAVGFCGHCQLGPHLLCKTGGVMAHERALPLMLTREL